MNVRITALIVFVCLLGCSGLDAAAPAGPAPGKLEQDVLFFRPSAKGCDWVRWSATSGPKTLGASAQCPDQVAFKPDKSKVVYSTGEGSQRKAIIASWPALATIAELPYPTDTELRWQPLWVSADGVVRLQGFDLAGEPVERGDELVWSAGSLSAVTSKMTRVLPGDIPYLVAKYEANRKGEGWTLLSTDFRPMELFPENAVDKDAWPSLASSYTSCNTNPICDKDDWKGRADLSALLGADAVVGFLPAASGGWLFAVRYGDTPHAQPPVFSCADPECKTTVALEDLPKENLGSTPLSVQPSGDYALIGIEGTMRGASIYRLGQSEPVYAAPDATYAEFLPKGL